MNTNAPARRCLIYARISVTKEESVSLARQIEAAEQYAAARGWQVLATYKDDGVSASSNRPEDRPGWRGVLEHPEDYDAVIVWKVDRLARRVLDFLNADEALQERGAGLVTVEQPIDMTTPEGRGFATMLAVFGELEAAAISARVKAARQHLIQSGRVVGGTLPYGWRSVPNPDGPGLVLAHDPARIDYVRGMVARVQGGETVYSVLKWLNDTGAPTAQWKGVPFVLNEWAYNTLDRLLRHPVLAGMTPFNPGNAERRRGDEVLRGPDGLPVVNESVAVMTVADWRGMVRRLDERDTPQARPRATKSQTSALLSGLVRCGMHIDDDGTATRMHRGTVQGREGYTCPVCHMTITSFEHVVVDEFLRQKGPRTRWSVVEEVHEGGAAVLPEIEHRLSELTAQLQATDDDDVADDLMQQIAGLRAVRREARVSAPVVTHRPTRHTQTFQEDWTEATEVEDQRAILDDAVGAIYVMRGSRGRRTDAQVLARLSFDWKGHPDDLGPIELPDDETSAAWPE